MSLNLSTTLPLTNNSTYTSTPLLSRVPLRGEKKPLNKKDHLQTLPFHWLTETMKYLSPYQICVLTSVSVRLYDSFDESRWRPLCQQFFPESYKKHAERLKSPLLDSRHFFMDQFKFMKGHINFNAQQKSDFLFKAALSEDWLLLENRKDKSLIIWNIKKGETIKRWVESDPIQKLFTECFPTDQQAVQDGRLIYCKPYNTITVHDLIEDKVFTLPCKDALGKSVVTFDKSQIIYRSYTIDHSEEKPVYTGIWKIWNVFKETTNILLSNTPTLFVDNVCVLDDDHIITLSSKTLVDSVKVTELAVWHVSNQQTIKIYTETARIYSNPIILNKRWVVYITSEDDPKVNVWDTLNNKKSDLPISFLPHKLVALNERLVLCTMRESKTFKIIDVLEGRQRDISNSGNHLDFLPLSNEFGISFTSNELAIWDDSAYKEEQLKRAYSSSSSSSSDTSSSSSSSSNTSLSRLFEYLSRLSEQIINHS